MIGIILLAGVLYAGRCWGISFSPADRVHLTLAPEPRYCYRLFNATHQMGCQSARSGSVGVLMEVGDAKGIEEMKLCWKGRFPDYDEQRFVVLLRWELLDGPSVEWLRSSPCISGVLLVDGPPGVGKRSHEAVCPNAASSLYGEAACSTQWNAEGAMLEYGVRFTDWNKPIVKLTNHSNVDSVRACISRYNTPSASGSAATMPLCAIRLHAFNSGAGNSRMCLRRNDLGFETIHTFSPQAFCDPLGDYNVFASLPPVQYKKGRESSTRYLLLATRMDSLSLMPEESPGDLSSLTSIVTLIAAASALGNKEKEMMTASANFNRSVLVSFFHGEVFDYIGSGRTAWDMTHDEFPGVRNEEVDSKENIELSQLDGLIEVQHIGAAGDVHGLVDGESWAAAKGVVEGLAASARDALANHSVRLHMHTDGQLPPAAAHSFLRLNRSIPAIVLTPWKAAFQDRRLDSPADQREYSGKDKAAMEGAIVAAADAIAASAADWIGMEKASVKVDKKLVSSLLDCVVAARSWADCDLLRGLFRLPTEKQQGDELRLPKYTYVGVNGDSPVRQVVYQLLQLLSGSRAHTGNVDTEEACADMDRGQTVWKYSWLENRAANWTACIRSGVFLTEAVSPGLMRIKGEREFVNLTLDSYHSTWTESRYEVANAQLLLLAPRSAETAAIVTGVAVAVLSVLAALVMNKHCVEAQPEEAHL